jgi:NAD(P)H-dependent flavin oxidoreductase YrpB (nitropropane dioxygenase family)
MAKIGAREGRPMKSLHTTLCDLLEIRYPILQAGMGVNTPYSLTATSPELVAAVSNAGGLGVLGLGLMAPDEISEQVVRTKKLTSQPFGVDLLFPTLGGVGSFEELLAKIPDEYWRFVEKLQREFGIPPPREKITPAQWINMASPALVMKQFEVLLEERVPLFVSGLGNPAPVIDRAHQQGMKVMACVGNVKTAKRVAASGVDAIAATGWEAGGHGGRIGIFTLVPQVVDAVHPIPVVAAGGIADGRQVAAALMLGAQGVWVGSLFLATEEAPIPQWYKALILMADDEGTAKSASWTGKLMRHFHTPITDAWAQSGLKPLAMPLQGMLMWDIVAGAIEAGKYEHAAQLIGQGIAMTKEIKPARCVVEDLVQGALATLKGR